MKLLFNPTSARFEVKQEFEGTSVPPIAPIVWEEMIFNCLSTVGVGDFVYVDPVNADTVIENVDNIPHFPTIGIVIAKPSATTCRVAIDAVITGFSGLVQGRQVFLSTIGGLTSTPPSTNYVQMLGYALSATKIRLHPEIVRARRAS